jgi:hypothetical protein
LTWQARGLAFDYLMAFYRVATARGVFPFLIDLPLKDGTMQSFKALFVPNSFTAAANSGLMFTFSARVMAVLA